MFFEEEATQKADSSWLSKFGDIGKSLLATGTSIYQTKTEAKIESSRLARDRIAAERASADRQAAMVMPGAMPSQAKFPILPVVLGIGALGVLMIVVMRKK